MVQVIQTINAIACQRGADVMVLALANRATQDQPISRQKAVNDGAKQRCQIIQGPLPTNPFKIGQIIGDSHGPKTGGGAGFDCQAQVGDLAALPWSFGMLLQHPSSIQAPDMAADRRDLRRIEPNIF